MTITNQTLTIYQGETYNINVTVSDNSGNAINITSGSLKFVVSKNQVDSPIIFKDNYSASGITIVDGSAGRFTITGAITDTNTINPGKYYMDCRVLVSGSANVVFYGDFNLLGSPSK